MYTQSFFVSSVRGIAPGPTIAASFSFGCTGFMNAAFGFRPDFFAGFFALFFAAFFPPFFAAFLPPFFFEAI
jgi:hypothetical protein